MLIKGAQIVDGFIPGVLYTHTRLPRKHSVEKAIGCVLTQQTHYAIMTPLLRQNDVIMLKWRRFDVITTLLLCHVFSGYCPDLVVVVQLVPI